MLFVILNFPSSNELIIVLRTFLNVYKVLLNQIIQLNKLKSKISKQQIRDRCPLFYNFIIIIYSSIIQVLKFYSKFIYRSVSYLQQNLIFVFQCKFIWIFFYVLRLGMNFKKTLFCLFFYYLNFTCY